MVVSPITSTSGDCRATNIAMASSTQTGGNSQRNKELHKPSRQSAQLIKEESKFVLRSERRNGNSRLQIGLD